MKLHEYQSKNIIQKENIDIPNGQIFNSINDFNNIDLFDSDAYVIKAQIHSGARGKAGLIQFANNKKNAIKVAKDLFGKKVKTIQSQGDLLEVNKIYIEEKLNIERQLYLAFILNHSKQSIEILYSSEGGVDIEENNQKIHSTLISQNKVFPFQTKKICNEFKIKDIKYMHYLLDKLLYIFQQNDATLLEINPLVITKDQKIIICDCKLDIDDNSYYRQKELFNINDDSQDDPKEKLAKEWNLNYIKLDGNIGCMVNGAGLAMATMDTISRHGGSPANFLDVGGGINEKSLSKACEIILNDNSITALLVNIFGGIVHCDLIANGVINSLKNINKKIHIVFRLDGTNDKIAKKIINNFDSNIFIADSLDSAANKIVQLTK